MLDNVQNTGREAFDWMRGWPQTTPPSETTQPQPGVFRVNYEAYKRGENDFANDISRASTAGDRRQVKELTEKRDKFRAANPDHFAECQRELNRNASPTASRPEAMRLMDYNEYKTAESSYEKDIARAAGDEKAAQVYEEMRDVLLLWR